MWWGIEQYNVNKEIYINPIFTNYNEMLYNCISYGSNLIDIGCGQWRSTFNLAKQCKTIVGIDHSADMLYHAYINNRDYHDYSNVYFLRRDATDLSHFQDNEFDYATIVLMIHAASPESRIWILKEAQRVAKRLIISDFIAPLSFNLSGIVLRITEMIEWSDHFKNFLDYQKNWWIISLLKDLNFETINTRKSKDKTHIILEVK